MILLKDIVVRFKTGKQEVLAADKVSLEIKKGEVFGIVGSSGAGKSTLLRTINLLQRPQSGSVELKGQLINHLKEKDLRKVRQNLGMIFQHFNLLQTRTVFENIALPLRIAHWPKEALEKRVQELLELTGLADKAQSFPAQLSGGQKQRVGIARAIANKPEVLLCDEPTSALDLETSASILELLKVINEKTGITLVLISHEMSVIKSICHRVAVMDKGKVVEEGAVFDIFARPRHPFTRQLVDRTFNLDLPEHLKSELPGKLLRVLFIGEEAEKPVLSDLSQKFAVSVNVLHGKIEYLSGRALGLLVILLQPKDPKDSKVLNESLVYLRQNTAGLELLEPGAQNNTPREDQHV